MPFTAFCGTGTVPMHASRHGGRRGVRESAYRIFGLTGRTIADGLAVGRPSGLAAGNMKPLLDGIYTVKDSFCWTGCAV